MIEKLLVANRGEIACRIMRSAHDMGIACVAVASDPDSAMPHVEQADEVVRLPGATPAETYLRSELLVEAARRCGADSVHPGYGFLSERAEFARACEQAGLTFVGPPAAVIDAMGSKLRSKAMMAAAGVPVLRSIEVPASEEVPDHIRSEIETLGWPILVKASAGGGGRGMRIVEEPSALSDALASAAREAQSAFGDGTVFLEPYVARPRHVEVQILGDMHGNVVHLFERECSIQRRHQKIVEESPSPAVDDALRAALGAAALTAARAIGYVNAGTVEFLVLPDGSFAFLEVNTRLQVEHPVTELVTGLDLVRLQLLIAEGHPLPPAVLAATQQGHAIEVRLYAEDATAQWRPSAGTLHRFAVPCSDGVRVDSGVRSGSVVGTHYDPMLAKVIAYGSTRDEAARRLASALGDAEIHGLTTNRDLLVRILRHPEFLAGETDTAFLERHDPAELGRPVPDTAAVQLHAIAAALAAQADRRRRAPVLAPMPSGWRNNPAGEQQATYSTHAGDVRIGYRFDRTGRRAELSVDGSPLDDVTFVSATPDVVTLEASGVTRRNRTHRVGATTFVDGPEGSSVLEEHERFPVPGSQLAPGSLLAPLPGTVVKVRVAVGDSVAHGDTLVAIEAMKMEHEVHAPAAGIVREVHVEAGEQVEAGRLLVVVEEQPAP
ncbi:MAG: acetyl/propionyl/methylcrotonyl-CoA carboxylase subunit alpha [Acidimicrobiales bacterium]